MVTSADRAAQKVYLRSLRECFPAIGIVAEEDELSIPSTLPGRDCYFAVDPLDGTKAFVRRQSAGIGTMLALVCDDEVLGAYVGDVMTQEIYGFRPGSENVRRISQYEVTERIEANPSSSLTDQYVSLREIPEDHTVPARRFVGAMGGVDVSSGSIGIQVARLWKGEVGAVLLPPSHMTPWDFAPVVGVSRRMGFGFYAVREDEPVPLRMGISRYVVWRPEEVVIAHESRLDELRSLLRSGS